MHNKFKLKAGNIQAEEKEKAEQMFKYKMSKALDLFKKEEKYTRMQNYQLLKEVKS